eukprot:835984-Pleurochrysis_carterae.AAC.1
MDLKPSLDSNGIYSEFLKDSKTTARDVASLKANKKREEDTTDYHTQYNTMMDIKPTGRNIEDLILRLYTRAIYDRN